MQESDNHSLDAEAPEDIFSNLRINETQERKRKTVPVIEESVNRKDFPCNKTRLSHFSNGMYVYFIFYNVYVSKSTSVSRQEVKADANTKVTRMITQK